MTALSKLWLFLVTLCGGLLALALLVLLPELQRVRREDQLVGMQLAQRTATLLLAEQAQRLVAAATQLASDAVLQTSLEEMGRGQAELTILHGTAQMELQRLSRDKALGAAFLLATDARGRVLARVGQDEAVYRDALDGWPLVSDALRGYRLDDLWLWQGTLYRVAAAPVVAPARDRYVGAVLVAQVVGNELAQALARVSALDAVFVCAGEVVGASLPGERVAVSELIALRAAGAPDRVTTLPASGEPVAFVELPGTAANQGAALVLIGRSMAGTSALEVARGAAARGLPPRLLAILIAAVAVVLAIGLLLLRVEVEGPLERLLAAVSGVTPRSSASSGGAASSATPSAGSPQLAERRYRGPLRQLARAIEHALHAASTPQQSSLATSSSAVAGAAAVGLPAAAAPSSANMNPEPMSAPPPVAPLPMPTLPTPLAMPVVPGPAPISAPVPLDALPTPTLPTPPAVPAMGGEGAVPTPLSPHIHTEETRVATDSAGQDDQQSAYYRVYQEFVQARERCQESVEGLNFELFRQRLQQSRDQIMQQHSCKTVQFHVHIKDGRATLRATPVWG